MKKRLLSLTIVLSLVLGISKSTKAQCNFISPTVDVTSIQSQGSNCMITFNLAFDIVTNSGNKIIFIHLWPTGNYPNLNYGCNQCQPSAPDLAGTAINMVIDNFNATPVFLNTYGPAPSVPVITPANNPGLLIQKTASATPGAERFIISNIKVVMPQACNTAITFTGDAWSSNANNNSAVVHCAMEGIQIGTNEPSVTSTVYCGTPGNTYDFTISTISNTKSVYYDVYLDDGNGTFEPGSDILINSLSSATPITVSPGTPYYSGVLQYPVQYQLPVYNERKLYVVVGAIGQTYFTLNASPAPSCGPLPVSISSFYAKRSNATVAVSWQTESEINAKEFVLQKKTDNGFIDIATIPAKNAATGTQYSYNDNNNSKGTTQYRLKLVDNDASFKYSEIRTVKGLSAASDFIIFPNPSKGDAKVTITDISEPTTVQLIDNSGRVLKNVLMNNSNTVSFNGLQAGLYMVRIINNNSGESLTKKLNVVN